MMPLWPNGSRLFCGEMFVGWCEGHNFMAVKNVCSGAGYHMALGALG